MPENNKPIKDEPDHYIHIESKDDEIKSEQIKLEILKLISKEASYRPLVPFLGAGISVSAGFPTIKFVIQYSKS